MRHLTLILVPLLVAPLAAQPSFGVESPTPSPADRQEIGARIAAAVDEVAGKLGDVGTPGRLVRIAATAAAQLPGESLVGLRLRTLADAGADRDGGGVEIAARVARALVAIASDLRFEPLREAPGPVAWPDFTAVGDIEVKAYPPHRMARSSMSGANSMSAFWKLFEHIQTRSIPMTAPVQVDYAGESDGNDLPASMAFLYEHASKGSAGADGRVEVVDVPALTVISIGARGSDSRLRVEQLRELLEDWLHANRAQFRVAGPLRTMGWNGPSVRGDRRYFEVRVPVVQSF